MTGGILVGDFTARVPCAPEAEIEAVVPLARGAALALGQATGRPVKVSVAKNKRAAHAFVSDSPFRLGITAGSYALGLALDVTADVEWLKDQALATRGSFGSEHANVDVADVPAAVAWIREHCLSEPVERVSSEELEAWDKTTILAERCGCDTDCGKRVTMTLALAVNKFGPKYRHGINEGVLAANHDLSEEDAKLVVAAVMKVLPRRKV